MRSTLSTLLLSSVSSFTPRIRFDLAGFKVIERGIVVAAGQRSDLVFSRTMTNSNNDMDNVVTQSRGLKQTTSNSNNFKILNPMEVDRLLMVSQKDKDNTGGEENIASGEKHKFAQEARASIVDIVNDAYEEGEKGILTNAEPGVLLRRVTQENVDEMITAQKLLVMIAHPSVGRKEDGQQQRDQDQSSSQQQHENALPEIIGCVKGEILDVDGILAANASDCHDENIVIGEWGCLAVAAKHQGRGYGNMLVKAVEEHLTTTAMKQKDGAQLQLQLQMDLISPTDWKHAHKERLRAWYTSPSMGYDLQVPDDYDESTTRFAKGFVFANTFLFVTDADMTKYAKQVAVSR